MAIYKREPITHKLPTDWDDTDAVSYFNINGFSGLSTYDNPLLNEQNSTYDSKNVYVDSTGSLTVRPRLVPADSNTYFLGALKVFIVGSYKFCIFRYSTIFEQYLYLKEMSISTSQSLKIKDIDAVTVVSDLDAAGNTLVYVIFTNIAGNIKYYRYNSDGTYTVAFGDVLLYSSQTSVDLQYKYYNILNDKVTRGYISSSETYDLTSFEKTVDKQLNTAKIVPDITVEYMGKLFGFSLKGYAWSYSDGKSQQQLYPPDPIYEAEITGYQLLDGILYIYTRLAKLGVVSFDRVGLAKVELAKISTDAAAITYYTGSCAFKDLYREVFYYAGVWCSRAGVEVRVRSQSLGSYTPQDASDWTLINAEALEICGVTSSAVALRTESGMLVYSTSGSLLYSYSASDLSSTLVFSANDTLFVVNAAKEIALITDTVKTYASELTSIYSAGFSSRKPYVVSRRIYDGGYTYTVQLLESGYTFKIGDISNYSGYAPVERSIYVSYDLSKVLYWDSSTDRVRYIEQIPAITETRPVDIIPVLSDIIDDFVTSFMLDGFWWFIFEHHIFATGAGAKGTLTLEYLDPRKYFSVSETITAAIRISDTSFWVLHNDGAYLIYKGSETDDDGFYTWYITNTAKSKGCDFLNGVCTLPATSYVTVVTSQDICSIQMRENVQTDERTLVPMTNALQVYIQDIISNTTRVVSARYKYLALFFMNKKNQDGKTPCLVYDDANSSWWVWEFPVYEVYQVVELESNIVFGAKKSTGIQWFTFSEDLYYNTSGYLQVPAYYDNLSDGSVTQIDWYWESAMLLFNSINYRKQLLETTFTFGEFNQRTADGLEQDASNFTYSFEVYAKRQSAKEGGISEATVTRAKNSTFRTLISTFTFLQLRLQNVEPESDEEYDLLSVCTKPQISNIIFKYRVLSGGIT